MSARAHPVRPDERSRPADAVHDRRVTVDGMRTQYLEAGAGPPLLLLHSHEQSATGWRWVVPALGELAIMISRLPGGDIGRSTMSAAMLFAQPGYPPRSSPSSTRSVPGRVSSRPPPP